MSAPNIPFREKLDIAQTFLRQLDRTNHAASYDYENSVRQKLNQLPQKWRQWVLDQPDIYEEERQVWIYKAPTGVKLGTMERPALIEDNVPVKRLEDGSIDWNDPNIISPRPKMKAFIDYNLLDATIMDAAEYAGLTWNMETTTMMIGTIKHKTSNKATPYRPQLEGKEPEILDDGDEEEET